jgi:phosphate:Na+ symporter
LAQNIFLSSDPQLAKQLLDYKKGLFVAERQSTANHMKRLREGLPNTIATSGMHTDVIRDLRRINTYVTSIAYGLVDNES